MRKSRAKNRIILPDPRYKDMVVAKFVNNLMEDGKKSTAYQVFYGAMDIIQSKSDQSPVEIFREALNNVMPTVEVKSRRVGGATFQVPTEVKPKRREGLGIRWLIKYAGSRNGKSMEDKLAAEFMAAAKGEGAAVKKKEDTHKMADANKAFSHFRF
ncbi:MAG: 30S ribosomal protein S7 [Bacteroidia bacterium]|jgi:small subunit ribosomal protein S7|nr:30S ribosomal protein S7 [Bacteroidia bacterium]